MPTINIAPSADTWVNNYAGNTNYGTSTGMNAGYQNHFLAATEYHEILMRFDIMSYIPANSIISSVKLFMYLTTASGGLNTNVISNIPTANRIWTESGVTWNNKPAYDNTYPSKTFGEGTAWSGVDITNYVKDMYNQGLAADFDIHFYSGNGGYAYYATKEYTTDTTKRPYLQVIYSPAVSATIITATPTSCTEPCDDIISVTWKNNDTVSHTFIPGITVDGTLYTGTAITLDAGATYTDSFNITGLTAGSHAICPVPN